MNCPLHSDCSCLAVASEMIAEARREAEHARNTVDRRALLSMAFALAELALRVREHRENPYWARILPNISEQRT